MNPTLYINIFSNKCSPLNPISTRLIHCLLLMIFLIGQLFVYTVYIVYYTQESKGIRELLMNQWEWLL